MELRPFLGNASEFERANLEVKWIEFGCEEYRKQQNHGEIMSEGSRSFPLKRGPVMRRELTDDTTSL